MSHSAELCQKILFYIRYVMKVSNKLDAETENVKT